MSRYITLLRCRSWADWPPNAHVAIDLPGLDLGTPGARAALHVNSYENRPRPEIGDPLPCRNPSPNYKVRSKLPTTGYWVGGSFLGGVGESDWSVDLNDLVSTVRQGEVDITVHIESAGSLDLDVVRAVVDPFSRAVAARLNMDRGDALFPVAPLQIMEVKEGKLGWDLWAFGIVVRERPSLSAEEVRDSLTDFVRARSSLTGSQARSLDVAMRRYHASFEEPDQVDRYCDLWEACEFATHGIEAKGGKVGKIARVLSDQMVGSGLVAGRTKAAVEVKMGLKSLYETRGNIVHEAMDHNSSLGGKTKLLVKIVEELIRNRLGVGYAADPVIEAKFKNPTS